MDRGHGDGARPEPDADLHDAARDGVLEDPSDLEPAGPGSSASSDSVLPSKWYSRAIDAVRISSAGTNRNHEVVDPRTGMTLG